MRATSWSLSAMAGSETMAESEIAKWLKSRYMVGPPTKKVKISKIHDELAAHFTSTKFNSLAVSQAIKEAFPNTVSKPCGKANHRFILVSRNMSPCNLLYMNLQTSSYWQCLSMKE